MTSIMWKSDYNISNRFVVYPFYESDNCSDHVKMNQKINS